MIYYVINNDFHIENIKDHIQITGVKECAIIRIPHSLQNDCKDLSKNIITIQTPSREKKKFWNPFNFYKAKRDINKISFTKNDKVVFLTEYDPLNQYIVFLAKNQGATIHLLEEGISFYAIYLFDNHLTNNYKYLIKLFYLRYIIGFHFFKYVEVGSKVFPQMKDEFIDKILLYFESESSRNIEIEIISNKIKTYDNLDKNGVVFLSQPLYDSYISIDCYLDAVTNELRRLEEKYLKVYFKFHPRDNLLFKESIQNILSENIIFIENQTLDDFFLEYKPSTAFSFFSDALFKLKQKGVKVRFLYKKIPELAKEQYLVNLEEIVKRLEDV
jgi:hypothetical protein